MLGAKLPISAQQTGDVDIAQFEYISVAVGDKTPPVLEVLKEVDRRFDLCHTSTVNTTLQAIGPREGWVLTSLRPTKALIRTRRSDFPHSKQMQSPSDF